MPRYDQWRRLRGSTDRPDLLDVGKKLLGYLAEQRRLSGVPTLAIERKLPDGSIVRARFDGELPCIEVQSAETQKQAPVEEGGFVPWPSDAQGGTPLTPESAVYLELAQGGYHRYYFDPTQATPPGTARNYAPWFPAGDEPSLERSGNTDWRSDDEKHAVTWHGAPSRYWVKNATDAQTFGGKVYRMGQVIFDWATAGNTLFPLIDAHPGTDFMTQALTVVMGAAIERTSAGAALLVVLRNQGSVVSDEQSSIYSLIRAPLPGYSAMKRKLTQPVVADMTVEAVLVLSARDANNALIGNTGFGHPWCFNSAATEARCMHNLVEMVLARDTVSGGWTFSQVARPRPGRTKVDTIALSYSHLGALYPNIEHVSQGSSTLVLADRPYKFWDGSSEGSTSNVMVDSLSQTYGDVVNGDPWIPVAVDYRSNVLTYAYGRMPETVSSNSGRSASITRTFGRVFNAFYKDPDVNAVASVYDYTDTHTAVAALDGSSSDSLITGGIRTPEVEFTGLGSSVGSSQMRFNGTDIGRERQSGPWSQFFVQSGSEQVTGLNYSDWTIANSGSRSTTTTRTFHVPLYLDLRNGFSAIAEVAVTEVDSASFDAGTYSYSAHADYVPGVPDPVYTYTSTGDSTPQATETTSRTITYSYRIKTRLKQAVLSDTAASHADTTGTSTVVNMPAFATSDYGPPSSRMRMRSLMSERYTALMFLIPNAADVLPAGVASLSFNDYCALGRTLYSYASNTTGAGNVYFTIDLSPNAGASSSFPSAFANLIGTVNTHHLYWMRGKTDHGGFLSYGSWQTYHDRYAFSHAAPVGAASTPGFAHGLSKVGLPIAVGAITNTVLYHPIWVLPPFSKKV